MPGSIFLAMLCAAVMFSCSKSEFAGNTSEDAKAPQNADANPETPKSTDQTPDDQNQNDSLGDVNEEFDDRLDEQGAQTGDIQVSLLWNNTNDLDLYVQGPNGKLIYFYQREDAVGGYLDVDMNADNPVSPASYRPVENVFWSKGNAKNGKYKIWVHHYMSRDGQITPYTVRIKVGTKVEYIKGSIAPPMIWHDSESFAVPQEAILVKEFKYPL